MGRQYKNPPLVEAVCEFRFGRGSPWDLAVPGLMYERLKDDFPKRRQAKAFEASIQAEPAGVSQQVSESDRFQLLRDDEVAIIQVSPNLLAVNHLRPYPTWQGFLPIIKKALAVYREVASPKGFQRIGLRYINHIALPGTVAALEDYFDFYPYVGPRLPQHRSSFVVGVQITFGNEPDVLRLHMGSGGVQKPGILPPFIIDLDYFLAQPGGVTFENVSEWLERAHSHIEDAFEGCLKDVLRQQFQEVEE